MRRIKPHTFEKLQYIQKYISAYLIATKSIKTKYYIDGFSGTGKCVLCTENCKSRGSKCNCGKGKEIDGSVLIAVRQPDKFSRYFLCELGPKNCRELSECLKKESPSNSDLVEVINGDCNVEIPRILGGLNRYSSCLTLLDPEGPELDWNTIVELSKFKHMDIMILFPYDMSLSRLVKDYKEMNNKFFGSDKWQDAHASAPTIKSRRIKMLNHFMDNLKDLGFTQMSSKLIKSKYRDGLPLYHFLLVSHYPIAAKIMDDIFSKSLDSQQKLFKN